MSLSAITRPTDILMKQKQPTLSLPDGEIHVWQVRVTDVVMLTDEFWRMINGAEKQKALRLRSETDQTRSLVSRGLLRLILGWYLGVNPASIEFSYGSRGKPFLAQGHGLEFSVSNSDELLLYAFAFGGPLGIDVERMTQLPELQEMARCYFSAREQDLLASLPGRDQRETFFRLWTLREAYGKMHGNGLTDEIRDVEILAILKEQDRHMFETFTPLPEYTAALVTEGCLSRLVRFSAFPGPEVEIL